MCTASVEALAVPCTKTGPATSVTGQCFGTSLVDNVSQKLLFSVLNFAVCATIFAGENPSIYPCSLQFRILTEQTQ